MQPVSVKAHDRSAEITGAACTLQNDKGSWFVTTPGSTVIQKSYEDLVVTCNKTAQFTGTGVFKSSSNGGVWGNLVAGGLIGYAVDTSSGAGFDYPSVLTVEMRAATERTPPTEAQLPGAVPVAQQNQAMTEAAVQKEETARPAAPNLRPCFQMVLGRDGIARCVN